MAMVKHRPELTPNEIKFIENKLVAAAAVARTVAFGMVCSSNCNCNSKRNIPIKVNK